MKARVFIASWLWLVCAAAQGQVMKDPTRPPANLLREATSGAAMPSRPQLQSVMLSASRRSAIISGERVNLGDRYGDAVLADVAQDHVVLRRGARSEVLKLYPGGTGKEVRRPGPN